MGIYPPLDGATFDELKQWWNTPTLPEWADSQESFFDELAYALSKQGFRGQQFLKSFLDAPDIARRCAALYFLADPTSGDPDIEQALQAAFATQHAALQTAAMWGLMNLKRFSLERAEVEQLYQGNDKRLSALAMVYLSRAFPDEQIVILRAGLASANPRQREYACDEIGDYGIAALMSDLQRLQTDPDTAVAQAAQTNYRPSL